MEADALAVKLINTISYFLKENENLQMMRNRQFTKEQAQMTKKHKKISDSSNEGNVN